MKRKRFKKLCMGLGFSRSMADGAAFVAWFCFHNYADGWRMMEATVADVNRARLATGADPSTPAGASAPDDRGAPLSPPAGAAKLGTSHAARASGFPPEGEALETSSAPCGGTFPVRGEGMCKGVTVCE